MRKLIRFFNKFRNEKDYKIKRIDITIPNEGESIIIEHHKKIKIPYINIILFLITIFTTIVSGAVLEGADVLSDFSKVKEGIPFSFTLISILGFHELGHYFASRFHNINATLPYFIPAPPIIPTTPPILFIGTFGAFIKVKSQISDKKKLLDIGAYGPIAGFLMTVPSIIFGLQISAIKEVIPGHGITLGNSLLLYFAEKMIFGNIPPGYDVELSSVAFAGFIGLLVTTLNLMPIGQLDGGHIVYALFGKKHAIIARIFFIVLLLLSVLTHWIGWLFWAILIYAIGFRHPPTANDFIPIDNKRKIIGCFCICIFILCFIPVPISI